MPGKLLLSLGKPKTTKRPPAHKVYGASYRLPTKCEAPTPASHIPRGIICGQPGTLWAP